MQFFRRSGPNDPVAGLIQVRRPDRVRLRSYARESGVLFAFRLPLDSEPDVGTTQDALQKAEEAGKMHSPSAARELLGGVELASAGGASGLENLAETGELKSNLLALGPKGKAKRLVLVNNVRGTGASGHATRLAASLTATSDLRVLILDPTRWVSSFREGFDSDQPTGLFDLFSRAPAKTSPIQKVGPGELYAARLTIDSPQLVDFFESGEIDSFLASLGADFDFVLLEIPGSAPFQECRSLCSQADAVVLVVDAGPSADQLALDAKRFIENPSEKLVGLIVHEARRRRPWPGFVVGAALAAGLVFGLGYWVGSSPDAGRIEIATRLRPAFDEGVTPAPPALVGTPPVAPAEQAAPPLDVVVNAPVDAVVDAVVDAPVDAPVEAVVDAPASALVQESSASPVEAVSPKDVAVEAVAPAASAPMRAVVVAGGDNLYRIILGHYGAYSKDRLAAVLAANPEIPAAGQIRVGQTIRLPGLD